MVGLRSNVAGYIVGAGVGGMRAAWCLVLLAWGRLWVSNVCVPPAWSSMAAMQQLPEVPN